MITFIPHKAKQLNFDVSIEGIDSSFLTASFTIVDDEISYSIKGKINGDRINFIIPPLNTFMVNIKDSYNAKLEIVGNKYYLQPWGDMINIFREPVATATVIDSPESLEAPVSAVFVSRDSLDVDDIPKTTYTTLPENPNESVEPKPKHPEHPQEEEKPRKLRQYDVEKKKQMKKIFEE
jgi:hypothetical protein